jgi:hypothetical protein
MVQYGLPCVPLQRHCVSIGTLGRSHAGTAHVAKEEHIGDLSIATLARVRVGIRACRDRKSG